MPKKSDVPTINMLSAVEFIVAGEEHRGWVISPEPVQGTRVWAPGWREAYDAAPKDRRGHSSERVTSRGHIVAVRRSRGPGPSSGRRTWKTHQFRFMFVKWNCIAPWPDAPPAPSPVDHESYVGSRVSVGQEWIPKRGVEAVTVLNVTPVRIDVEKTNPKTGRSRKVSMKLSTLLGDYELKSSPKVVVTGQTDVTVEELDLINTTGPAHAPGHE